MAAAAIGTGLGCDRRQPPETVSRPEPRPLLADDGGAHPGQQGADDPWQPFPVLEAAGSPGELGAAIGRLTADRIRQTIDAQREWFDRLRTFALADRAGHLDPFVAAIERHHPEVMAELRGLAQGAGLPVDDIVIWNLQPELGTMVRAQSRTGCSTLHLSAGGRLMIAHNEDGNSIYRRQLVILQLRPTDRPAVTCLAYPGLIPGQVPSINAAGIALSTNFIGTEEVRPGVPRYALGRAVLACSTIDQAMAVVTNPDRAFAFTLHIGSTRERRLACVEIAPRAHDVREAPGLFVHTNHLILPATRDVPQGDVSATGSSGSRLQVLTEALATLPAPEQVTERDLVRLLASHEAVRQPYSPCRHPTDDTSTQTLATAVFDVTAGTFALHEGNPCEGRRRTLQLPS